MPFTYKQARFIAAKMTGAGNRTAALRAGYSARTAAVAGARLARHPKVLAELAARRAAVRHLHVDCADPLAYMLATMNNPLADPLRRDKMAIAAAPFVHVRAGEVCKKDAKDQAAKKAATGKFGSTAPPLALVRRTPPDAEG